MDAHTLMFASVDAMPSFHEVHVKALQRIMENFAAYRKAYAGLRNLPEEPPTNPGRRQGGYRHCHAGQ